MKRFGLLVTCVALSFLLSREVFSQSKVARTASNAMIEKVLQGLEVKFEKGERKDKDSITTYYDFTRSNLPCRLYNYGNDLWIEHTTEKALAREEVNRWNADAKFSRLVLIEEKGKMTVSLEAQLDCLGGVTEATVKQYLIRFDEESKKFAKFVK